MFISSTSFIDSSNCSDKQNQTSRICGSNTGKRWEEQWGLAEPHLGLCNKTVLWSYFFFLFFYFFLHITVFFSGLNESKLWNEVAEQKRLLCADVPSHSYTSRCLAFVLLPAFLLIAVCDWVSPSAGSLWSSFSHHQHHHHTSPDGNNRYLSHLCPDWFIFMELLQGRVYLVNVLEVIMSGNLSLQASLASKLLFSR